MIYGIKFLPHENPKIPLEALTELTLNGEGVLDRFLQIQRKHLDREYRDSRITGKEYSEAFVNTYTTSLQQAIEFLLAKERQFYELDLLAEQANKVKKDIELADVQIQLAQKELELKDKELTIAEQQLELMRAKVVTEKAQTDGSLIGDGSVLGKQNEVLDAQIAGYKRDAEQKAAQLMLQTWITRMNNDSAFAYEANMLQDKFIGRSVEKLFEGVNIDTTDFDEDAPPPNPTP